MFRKVGRDLKSLGTTGLHISLHPKTADRNFA